MLAGILIFRVDATVEMGTGHVMRCVALAQAWQDRGGGAAFVMAHSTPSIDQHLHTQNFGLTKLLTIPGTKQEAMELAEIAYERAADWVVVDGYQFRPDYHRTLKESSLRVLSVEDVGEGRCFADIILNQNSHANENMYPRREPHTCLLLGSRYAMLRREFLSWREWRRDVPPIGHKVLVTMGGSDAGNVTANVIHALHQVNVPFNAKVIVGSSNPHGAALERAVGSSSAKIELIKNPSNMPELMAWADVAIAAAGSTCWEICLLGLPSILIDVAPNQRAIAQELHASGCAIHLGTVGEVSAERMAAQIEWLLRSPQMRAALSSHARGLVDGQGASRVVSAILAKKIRLRRAVESDSRLLFEWANDPEVRANSFSSAPIPWKQHEAWFAEKLCSLAAVIFIAVDNEDNPIGLLRYDILDNHAVLSMSLDHRFRGMGCGTAILSQGLEELFRSTQIEKIRAYVKPENLGSVRLFTKSGFIREETEVIQGRPAIGFVLERVDYTRKGSHRDDIRPCHKV